MVKEFFRTYWPTLTVVAVIIYATWFPDPVGADELPVIPHIDKLVHAVMFGGLAGAAMFDYHRASPASRPLGPRAVTAACCLAAAFGVVDEVVQGMLSIGRATDPADILADIAGIAVAAFTAPPLIRAIFRKKS